MLENGGMEYERFGVAKKMGREAIEPKNVVIPDIDHLKFTKWSEFCWEISDIVVIYNERFQTLQIGDLVGDDWNRVMWKNEFFQIDHLNSVLNNEIKSFNSKERTWYKLEISSIWLLERSREVKWSNENMVDGMETISR